MSRHLDVEKTDAYAEANYAIKCLRVLKNYYKTDEGFENLELEGIPLRELFMFMSDNGFAKKGFISDDQKQEIMEKIEQEIENIETDLKKARLKEIEEKELHSLLIIPSWANVIGYQTKGFYLGRPVLDIKRDTIVMLSYDILTATDKLGTEVGILVGPGIFFTKFSISQGSYVINAREINMIMLPIVELDKLLNAPPIFTSDLDATMNELLSILPFNLIEETFNKQAILRGVMSRNVFHPNKDAFDEFLHHMDRKDSFNPKKGFKILSAHPEYFNRLLLSQRAEETKADASFNLSSAGIQAILENKQMILDELIPPEQQYDLLLKMKDMKFEFNKVGRKLLNDWIS